MEPTAAARESDRLPPSPAEHAPDADAPHADAPDADAQLVATIIAGRAAGPIDPCGSKQQAHQAFLELYERHARPLLGYLSRAARPAAVDDIAQDAWRRAWERLPAKPPGAPFRAWLFTVARNLVADSYRDATRRRAVPIDEENSPEPVDACQAIDQGLLDEDVRRALAGCLERLTERPRQVVRLRWRGENYTEVCQSLNLDHNQAYKAYHQAVRQLGECLERANVV